MSFLRNFYSKVTNDSIRKNSFVNDNANCLEVEEFEQEDGFVLYTTSKTAPQTDRLEFNRLQTSATPGYFPTGSSLQTASHGGQKNIANTMVKQESSTFLTASDVPMQLAKHLDLIAKQKQSSSSYLIRRPEIRQFCYDFHLEKSIVKSHEGGFR